MTKPPTLHRFILVDQNHAKKEECTAHGLAGARKAFEALRQAKGIKRPAIPTSWTIVKREPVKAAQASRSEPRAFRVGDRVRIVYTEEGVFKVGDEAKIVAPCAKGTHGCWMAEFDGGHTWHIQPGFSEAELLTTAPQPKAEEENGAPSCLCHSSTSGGWQTPDACPIHGWRKDPAPERVAECIRFRDYNAKATERFLDGLIENPDHPSIVRHGDLHMMLHRLMGQFQGALDMPGEFWGELVAAAKFNKAQVKTLKAQVKTLKAEVKTLKAEVERLEGELEAERNSVCDGTCYEAVKAEAKLDDIRAINRVAEIVNARPDDAEPWHWQGLVQSVLDGAA